MISTYIIASAVFFTLMAIVSALPPRKDHDAIGALVHGVFATTGWAACFWPP